MHCRFLGTRITTFLCMYHAPPPSPNKAIGEEKKLELDIVLKSLEWPHRWVTKSAIMDRFSSQHDADSATRKTAKALKPWPTFALLVGRSGLFTEC